MKFSKLDLLTLLISLFLFSSCKDASTIGLDIDPANAVKGTLLDTVTVTSRTLADIPTATYSAGTGLVRYPLGTMTDATFGTTTASLAMSVNLPNATPYSFGKSVIVDSVVLVLPYQRTAVSGITAPVNEFYGDSTAVYNISVNQLNLNLSTQGSWLSSKTYAAGALLGSFTGSIKPNTRVSVIDVLTGAKDTVLSAPPQMRIKLDASLIKSKIIDPDSLLRNTDAKFNALFNGLKVTATSASKNGGIMFFDFTTATAAGVSGASNVEIYYRKQGTTTLLQDTVVARFPILTTTNAVAATVTHNYANTPVATQLNTPGEYQTTYLQAMGGLRNKISFPYLKDLVSKIGSKIVINKAELVVDISDAADSIPFKIPPRLALYRYDIAEQRQQIPDNNPYSSTNTGGDVRTASSGFAFGGYYNATKKSYTFVVTNYIQDLVDGKSVDYGTFLAPTAYNEFNVFPFPTSAGRATIGSFNNTNNRKIRLNIYYIKASQ